MPKPSEAQQVLELIDVMQELTKTVREQTKHLERLTLWLAQQTELRDMPGDLNVESSIFAALLQRLTSLRARIESDQAAEEG